MVRGKALKQVLLGDIGKTFYIILEGSVSLKVPTIQEVALEDLLAHVLSHESEIDWRQLGISLGSEEPIAAIHDSVKYSLQKVERAAKHHQGKTLRDVIRDMQEDKEQ